MPGRRRSRDGVSWRCVAAWAGLLSLWVGPFGLAAQVELRVTEEESGLPIAFPTVSVLGQDGQEIASLLGDAQGLVVLPITGQTAVVGALGFLEARVDLPDSGTVAVVLQARPIELDGLTAAVEGRGRSAFSERRARGAGLFLDPADVQLKVKYHVTDAFRDLPGVRRSMGSSGLPELVSSLGPGCFMYRLDNTPLKGMEDLGGRAWRVFPLSMVTTENVMAIEVYRYFGEVPPELRHQASGGGGRLCGLIIIWTTVAW